MYFEWIKDEKGNQVKAFILPEVEIDFDKYEAHAFIARLLHGNFVKDGDKTMILKEIFTRNFKFAPGYKEIIINDTKYDVPEFYNKDMFRKNDEKAVSMLILQILYDEIWQSVIDYANLKGLKSDIRVE